MTERADIGEGADSDDEYTDYINDELRRLPQRVLQNATERTKGIMDAERRMQSASNFNSQYKTVTLCPQPLLRKTIDTTPKKAEDCDNILEVTQASIMQDQIRRDIEHHQRLMDREDGKVRREEERRIREEERVEDRERREEGRRRGDNMMKMIMATVNGKESGGRNANAYGENIYGFILQEQKMVGFNT